VHLLGKRLPLHLARKQMFLGGVPSPCARVIE
jgi:hypothetical protein